MFGFEERRKGGKGGEGEVNRKVVEGCVGAVGDVGLLSRWNIINIDVGMVRSGRWGGARKVRRGGGRVVGEDRRWTGDGWKRGAGEGRGGFRGFRRDIIDRRGERSGLGRTIVFFRT